MTFEPHTQTADRKQAWSAGLLLLVMMTGHTVLETARDSLFLARLPASRLPWTYASIALAALLAAELNGRLRSAFGHRRVLAVTLFAGALGSAVFIELFRLHVSWAPYAFYVWIAVIATLSTAQFWLLVSELFTVLEAKQLYAVISAGGLLGAMLGGGLSRVTASWLGDLGLLGLGGALFFVAGLVPVLTSTLTALAPKPVTPYLPPSDAGSSSNVRDLRTEHYLQRLLALTLLSTLAATVIDYMFKVEIAQRVPAQELGSFFGTFNMWVGGSALLVQFVIAPRLLRSAGVGRSLLLLPAVLAVASLGVVAVPSFLSVLLLRGSDASLRYSLHRSSLEVLFLPLSTQARARWKMVVDVLGQRGGQALAALVIFGCIAAELSVWQMAALVMLLTLGWAALAATMESRYVALFRAKVQAGAIETRAEVPALDLLSLESLVTSLGSENDDEVLATIELLVEYERTHVIPALLLYHPSRAVVIRTLEVFANAHRHDFAGAARRLLERDDDELRAAAMLALADQMPPQELRAELSTSPPVATRAAVLVALIARKLDTDGSCAREVDAGCDPAAPQTTRLAFARAIRLQGGSSSAERLPRLLLNAGPELEAQVARAMLATPNEQHLPALLHMLGSRRARDIARDALVAIGEPGLRMVASALDDVSLPQQLRAHLPRSISRFGSAAATDILLQRLQREEDGWVRFKIIRGLGQLRQHMGKGGRMQAALELARKNLVKAVHLLAWQLESRRDQARVPELATQGGELLTAVLHDKALHATDRAVRLVGLMHAANVMHNIRQALGSRDPRVRADGIELLVHRAPQDIAQALSALLERGERARVDEARDESRLLRAAQALHERVQTTSYEERLSVMLGDSSEAVRSVAAYHVGELGLQSLSSELTPPVAGVSSLSREVFARAGELLEAMRAPARPVVRS